MEYKQDIKSFIKKADKIDLNDLITTIIHLYGKNNQIDESLLENILINILTEDGYNIACLIYNTPGARDKLNWHYDIQKGEGYITSK